MTRFLSILTVGLALVACGGAVDQGTGDDTGGQPGSTGGRAGGSGAAGSSGAYAGSSGAQGGSAGAAGTGSGGTGSGGASGSCIWGGVTYLDGEGIPSGDCNACFCNSGQVACTSLFCSDSCENVRLEISAALADARACNPQQSNPCSLVVAGALDCSCPTYVNPENEIAIAALTAAHEEAPLSCNLPVCDCAIPTGAICSPEGQCVDVWDEGSLAACQVNGEVYPSGSSGFPGPLGCNTCSCDNGQLSCTEEDCPSACPPNSVNGSHCVQCGPTDGCEVVEYTCLEVCTDTCNTGVCLDGVCKNVCG